MHESNARVDLLAKAGTAIIFEGPVPYPLELARVGKSRTLVMQWKGGFAAGIRLCHKGTQKYSFPSVIARLPHPT